MALPTTYFPHRSSSSPHSPRRSLSIHIIPSTPSSASSSSASHVETLKMEALSAILLCVLSSAAATLSPSTTPGGTSSTSSEAWTTTSTTPSSTSTTASTTTTTRQSSTTATTIEWRDMDESESDKLVDFVVSEIQKMKMEHRELDECQELNLSSVLSGKKLSGKVTKYSVTLKVQPQVKNSEICLQKNDTLTNMHPEICEADVTEGDHGGTEGKTLLRSTCLQVEELQD